MDGRELMGVKHMRDENKPFKHLIPGKCIHDFMMMDAVLTVLSQEQAALLPSYKGPLPQKMPLMAFGFITHCVMRSAFCANQGIRSHDEVLITLSQEAFDSIQPLVGWRKEYTYAIVDCPRFDWIDNTFIESDTGMYEDVIVEIRKMDTFKLTLRIKRPELE